jgi:mannitol-1-phosphate 5-dehydrogenase
MVPVQTDEMKDGEPLRICTESYGFLPVDKAAFKGTIPDIKGMVPFEPFDFFVKRKLFIHNMAHATTAYLGDLIGKEYIYEAIDNPDILLIVQNAMMESAQALVKRYGVDMDWMLDHINDLLRRFANITLKDTCARVGGDPARKLSPGDRLAGSMKLAEEEGICPAYIAVGAAAGLRRYLKEAGLARNEEEALKALENVSQIPKDSALAQLVLEYFRMISTSCSIAALRREAQRRKALSLMSII